MQGRGAFALAIWKNAYTSPLGDLGGVSDKGVYIARL